MAPRRDIQGLRALAVALVLLDHAGVAGFGGGFVGVDVFFVVSGFLITTLLLREADGTGRVSLTGFYARRARRILPAATVVLVSVTVWSGLLLPVARARQVFEDVLWSSLFLANAHFAELGTDYFALGRAASPVQHYWSLAVEEQFYLVWPLLLVVLVARRRTTRVVAAVVGVLAAASFAWSVADTAGSPTTAYFSSLTRGWELAAGALLALGAPRLLALSRRTRVLLGAAGLAAVLLAACGYDGATAFPGWRALLPVLGTAALLAAGVAEDGRGVVRVLTLRPCTWVGDLSYSLYLWHWPVLVLGGSHLGGREGWRGLLLLVVALGASVLSYHLVEQPFRRGRLGLARGRAGLALWPLAVASVVVAVLWSGHHEDRVMEARAADAQRFYARLASAGDPLGAAPESVPARVRRAVALADRGAPVDYPLGNLDRLQHERWTEGYGCFAGFDRSQARICPVGDAAADRTVVAFGDSHTGQWLPALDILGRQRGFAVVPLVKFACPSFDVPTRAVGGTAGYTSCDRFRDWALGRIRAIRPDLVVLGNRGLPPNLDAGAQDAGRVWQEGVRSTVEAVRRTGAEVRVLGDVPRVEADPGACLSGADATMARCTVDAYAKSLRANRLTRRGAAVSGVPYVDLVPLVCAGGRCPLSVGHTVVRLDDDHITVTWARQAAHAFGRRLELPSG